MHGTVAILVSVDRLLRAPGTELNLTLLLLCSHSRNDVPPVPQRNVSIAAERGAVRPSMLNLTTELILIYSDDDGLSALANQNLGNDPFISDEPISL